MDIKDLDFKELLQKPVESPFFTRHLEEQLSNQELETVMGGLVGLQDVGDGIMTQVCVPWQLPPYYKCITYVGNVAG